MGGVTSSADAVFGEPNVLASQMKKKKKSLSSLWEKVIIQITNLGI